MLHLNGQFLLNMRTLLLVLLCWFAPVVLAEVKISGLSGAAEDNVRLMLSIAKEKCDAPGWKIQGLFEKADEEIDQALRALGYYHSVVKKTLVLDAACWQADFTIDSGPLVIISEVNISIKGDARDDRRFLNLLKILPLKKGSPVNHGQYESMKSRIESLALERGYLKGKFTENKLLIDKQNNTAQIILVFDAGKRMVFGEVTIEQDILNPEFVKKYLSIKPGAFYTSDQLVKTHNALSKSGYFEMIDIRPEIDSSGQQPVPVTIKLTAKPKHHYGFGLGYDTDIGPLVNAAYTNRRINRRGHVFSSNIDISPVLSVADVEYTIPLDDPVNEAFSFGGGLKNENTESYKSTTATLSTRLKHAFESGWKQALFIDYSYEKFDTGTENRQTLLLAPGGNWLKSVSNNPLRPSKGHRLEFEVKGSYENPISNVSFAQAYLSMVWIQKMPLNGKFIGRTEQGATLVDQFDRLPTTYRYYAGGMNSIRGYAYKELGPKDSLGNVEGGRFLSVVSAEYEQTVLENWGVAAFIDTGNSYNLDNIQLKTGVGLGVRWYSPIGPVRIDFALPLNESDSSFQIHFAAGARI